MDTENPDEPMNAEEAAEYLRQKWGLPTFSVDAFRQYRYRRKIKQQGRTKLPNSSLWRRSYLDQLPEPDKTKRRTPEESGDDPEDSLDIRNRAVLSFA
jgi:hypothetical protein